jgi:hypothetical protein
MVRILLCVNPKIPCHVFSNVVVLVWYGFAYLYHVSVLKLVIHLLFCGELFMVYCIHMYFILRIDLVLLVSRDVVSEVNDDSSVVDAVIMDS